MFHAINPWWIDGSSDKPLSFSSKHFGTRNKCFRTKPPSQRNSKKNSALALFRYYHSKIVGNLRVSRSYYWKVRSGNEFNEQNRPDFVLIIKIKLCFWSARKLVTHLAFNAKEKRKSLILSNFARKKHSKV